MKYAAVAVNNKTMKNTKLDVFEYADFRRFIEDRMNELSAENSKYSRRYFCRKLGLASNNYLKMIIDGARSLTDSLAPKVAEVLGLSGKETAFFIDLVKYNQAKTTEAKNKALQELRLHRRFVKVHRIAIDKFDYFADPVTLAMREVVALNDFRENYDWIASRLLISATDKQIEEALNTLLRLGQIERAEDGTLRQTNAHQDTGPQLGSAPLRAYHINMLKQAAESIELPVDTRYFQGLTVTIPSKAYEKVIEKIQEAMEEIRKIVDEEEPSEEVYHLETAFFPLTKRGGGKPPRK